MNTTYRRYIICIVARPVVLVLLAILAQSTAAQIYETRDSQGRRTYTDQPLPGAVRRTDVERQRPPNPDSIARAAQTTNAMQDAEAARKAQELARQQADAAKRQVDVDLEKQCIAARNQLLDITQIRRPYRRDASGERIYLTSAEIDQQRAAAQEAVTAYCGRGRARPR